jgi:hypothetical protein
VPRRERLTPFQIVQSDNCEEDGSLAKPNYQFEKRRKELDKKKKKEEKRQRKVEKSDPHPAADRESSPAGGESL